MTKKTRDPEKKMTLLKKLLKSRKGNKMAKAKKKTHKIILHVRPKGVPLRMAREIAEKLNEVIDYINKKGL